MFDATQSHRPIGWRWALVILVAISLLFWAVTVVRPVAVVMPVSTESSTDKTASTIGNNNRANALKRESKQFTREGIFTISGRVMLAETDAPAESVLVYATGGADPKHAYEATTDSEGHYRLHVESDSYEIHASCKGFVCTPLIGQRANAGETLEVSDLKLEKGGYIGGKVFDQKTGQPVSTTRAGKPLFVAYACWGNRRNYKEFGSVQVADDGTYLLEVPLKSCPLVYLRDEEVAYSCQHEAFTPRVKSTELHQIDFEIVGPRNDAAFIPAPSPLDEVLTAETGEEVEVQVVLNELRKLHRTIKTGEFTAREEFVSLTPEGRQETIVADLRGVFDREHNLVRHEYRRHTPRLQRTSIERMNSHSSNSPDLER